MADGFFEQFYPVSHRLASARAAAMVRHYGLPSDTRNDLAQEVLLTLWQKRSAFDPGRGSWRTFAEKVAANKLASLARNMRSQRSGCFRTHPLDEVFHAKAPDAPYETHADVWGVLASVSPFDRSVAICLTQHSVIETCQNLGVRRASVYRAIERLKAAFVAAGVGPKTRKRFFAGR